MGEVREMELVFLLRRRDGKKRMVKWWLHNEARVGAERCMKDMTD